MSKKRSGIRLLERQLTALRRITVTQHEALLAIRAALLEAGEVIDEAMAIKSEVMDALAAGPRK
ncbi:MAG: hypothetical protein WBJ68_14090 [Candidatus Dechloromonas phosphoritropha]|jgi:hypothetical protein